jgi:hypothetical protein
MALDNYLFNYIILHLYNDALNVIWNSILQSITKVIKDLQSSTVNASAIVSLY